VRQTVRAEWLILAAFVCVLGLFILPGRDCFQFDYDEGVNLAKSQLVAQGYRLYADIWSDQPPLLTLVQAAAFRLAGFSVHAGRAVVLAFAALLLWATWEFMRLAAGRGHALLAVLLTIQIAYFARLSIAAMVGLPMLALGLVALALLAHWHTSRDPRWLALSAVALSLSVLTKLQSAFLAPIFVAGLLVSEWRQESRPAFRRILTPALLWVAAFSATTLTLIGVLVGPSNLGQLLEGHVRARETDFFGRFSLWLALDRSQALLMLGPALLGAHLFVRHRRWLGLYLLAWAGVAFALLLKHAPVWYHHVPLLMVPMAMLAAYAAGEALGWLARLPGRRELLSTRGVLFAAAVGCLCLSSAEQAVRAAHAVATWPRACSAYDMPPPDAALARLKALAPGAAWCVTDVPMYALRAGIPVAPDAAVLTIKRLKTGEFTEQDMLAQIARLKPRVVYLARFDWPAVLSALDKDSHYRIEGGAGAGRLYVRID
jgi:4-amino-4-deoxy-L-arabinose transferase-like glycosyltransferase